MSYSLASVLLLVALFLSCLFAVALLADRHVIPKRISHHPATYILSLGIFTGAMASNGAFEMAYGYGYNFLIYYTGIGLLFVLSGLLLLPLLRLSRVYQLASLADLLTFRFRSARVGAAVTVAMCIALMPLLALQIQALGDSIQILGTLVEPGEPSLHHRSAALLTCVVMTVFAMLFGAGNISAQERNEGLVTAMAFASLVKLIALLLLGGVAVFGVFGGPFAMQQWLQESPAAHEQLTRQLPINNAQAFTLLFFAGGLCMPHVFHMLFAENTESRDLRSASWSLPLYLMLLSLPVLPIVWAGLRLDMDLAGNHEYTGLLLGHYLNSPLVSILAFLATLAAAGAAIIVATLALANMCLNHLILPSRILNLSLDSDIYRHLRWLRRGLIAVLILGGYFSYLTLDNRQNLVGLAYLAFSGTLHFLPGLIATPYWPAANRSGFLAGLWGGLAVWFVAVLLPVTRGFTPEIADALSPFLPSGENTPWAFASMLSLAVNVILFILVSLLAPTTEEEKVAAEICSMDDLNRPVRQLLPMDRASEFVELLRPALGERTAQAEVRRALDELQFTEEEARPYALRRLRRRIEANLSGLLGPAVAHNIIERCIPIQAEGTEDIALIERFLDNEVQFTGLAADLDALRRRHRETLDALPVGLCSMGSDGEMLMWNRTMVELTGVTAPDVLGSRVDTLPSPWGKLLSEFRTGDSDALLKVEVSDDDGNQRWLSLHKSLTTEGDTMLLAEDITDFERMEEELLHNERLASIGRLSAGVAHEIGNPVTAIACLAQNLDYAVDGNEIASTAQDILRQTERVSRIVDSLVNFSHAGSQAADLELKPCNLADCVDEAIHLLSLDREATPVQFHNSCDREVLVLADSQLLLQVFVNLLGNARDASGEDGSVQIRAYEAGERILIDVEDNGHGIPAALQSHIFEPFFTTKEPGQGTGLGLALVYSIMDDLGGSVHLTSPLQQGANPGSRFTLELALASYGETFEM